MQEANWFPPYGNIETITDVKVPYPSIEARRNYSSKSRANNIANLTLVVAMAMSLGIFSNFFLDKVEEAKIPASIYNTVHNVPKDAQTGGLEGAAATTLP